MRYDHRDWITLAVLGLLASLLLLSRLDQPYLWQDEAQTAVIARTVLDHGVPLGSDGRNFFSQEGGVEYADGYLWKWHTWLSFYVVAAFFALLGPTTEAARLPFALFGLATVLLAYVAGRRLWGTRTAGAAGAALLVGCVPYLVLSRQCRWYGMATFFSLLGLYAYTRVGPGERRYSLLLFAAATLLFHTHYFYVAILLATLLLHSLWLERERFRRVLWISAAVTVVNLPWILWFSTIRYGDRYADYLTSLGVTWQIGSHLTRDLLVYFPGPVIGIAGVAVVAWRLRRREPLFAMEASTRSHVALLLLFCAVGIAALAVLAPGAYFRYLAPMAPAPVLVAGAMLGSLAGLSRGFAVGVFALWLGLSPMRDFVYEITHDFEGPIEGIVSFLHKHARPGDVVAISYGDMPLKFYTDLRIVGGLTGEDLSKAAGADWIILRHHAFTGVDRHVKKTLAGFVVPGEYREYRLSVPDTAFENREDPRMHLFRSAPKTRQRVIVYGRVDPEHRQAVGRTPEGAPRGPSR